MEFIIAPWPWYVAGPLIAFTMFLLLYFGNNFGVSATLRTTCSIAGGEKLSDFFDFDWKAQIWNLIFVLGTLLGGTVSSLYLEPTQQIELADTTIAALENMGLNQVGESFLPAQLFEYNGFNPLQIGFLLFGGLLVGFGARYAGGCTSGHAISGLSNLQLPSLIAVVGFFIGGLIMNYLIMPNLLPLIIN